MGHVHRAQSIAQRTAVEAGPPMPAIPFCPLMPAGVFTATFRR